VFIEICVIKKDVVCLKGGNMKTSRINYGFAPNPFFEERIEFNHNIPHSIRMKTFDMNEFVPFHYGKTMEILICDNLKGEIIVDSEHYKDLKKTVLVIPPNTIHATNILICEGALYTLKFSFEHLQHYLQIDNILSYQNKDIFSFPYQVNCYEEIICVINNFFLEDGNIFERMKNILTIFEILVKCTVEGTSVKKDTNITSCSNLDIKGIINWTKKNFAKQIVLQDVADFSGYSKYYFCSQFKKYTRLTYMTYLNQIRIDHAKLLLSNPDKSITSICFDCGFESPAYFSQLFKKDTGVTPNTFRKTLLDNK
jgi:AraC-like DNA-binding protein